METIRAYLETMFQNLPNLPQVQKAKYELGQMMEDKYQELKNEGKTENEAVAVVISEFGNLDELAGELGIETAVCEEAVNARRLSMEEAKQYVRDRIQSAYRRGLGVLLCIMSPCGAAVFDYYQSETLETIGNVILFALIAAAVGLFVYTGYSMGKWDFVKKQPCSIDFLTAEYVSNEKENSRMTSGLMVTIGVMLCVFSVIPVIIFDDLIGIAYLEGYGQALMFLMVGIAVLLFIAAKEKRAAYDTLLRLNAKESVGAQFVPAQKEQIRYRSKTLEEIMSVYWPTITCLYLSLSFLTFEWGITWIIWLIAAFIAKMIAILGKE